MLSLEQSVTNARLKVEEEQALLTEYTELRNKSFALRFSDLDLMPEADRELCRRAFGEYSFSDPIIAVNFVYNNFMDPLLAFKIFFPIYLKNFDD